MTAAVKELLNHFERLSEQEQQEAARAILVRTVQAKSPALSDEQLTALADETFFQLDQREAGSEADRPTLEGLLKIAGTVNDLPPDMAEQHDHYIHGTPRR
jgi:hypothetical protein